MSLHNANLGKLLLRLAIGGLMLFHGISKLTHGVGGIAGAFEASGLPGFLANLAYLGEVVAPLMVLIGFRNRLGGLLIAATMLVAILVAHSADIFTLTDHGAWGIELQMLFLLGGLAIAFIGSGKYAIRED